MNMFTELVGYRETRDRLWDRNFSHSFLNDKDRLAVMGIFNASIDSSRWIEMIANPDYARCKGLVDAQWEATRHYTVEPQPNYPAIAQQETVSDLIGTKGEIALDKYLVAILGR